MPNVKLSQVNNDVALEHNLLGQQQQQKTIKSQHISLTKLDSTVKKKIDETFF